MIEESDNRKGKILGEAIEFHRRLIETSQARSQRRKREREQHDVAVRRVRVFELIPDPAALCRVLRSETGAVRDIEILDSNHAFERFLNDRSEGLPGSSLFGAVKWVETPVRGLIKHPADRDFSASFEARRPDHGAWFRVSVSGTGPDELFLLFSDVTSLKQEALRLEAEVERLGRDLVAEKTSAGSPDGSAQAPIAIKSSAAARPAGSRRRKAEGAALTFCEDCKRLLDEHQHWIPFEIFMDAHADVGLNPSLCPYCKRKNYPDAYTEHGRRA